MSAPLPTAGVTTSAARGSRVASVDIVRGAVMVLMAIDHVRVFSGVPAGGPDVAVFFTRWVTHFCAPAFIFLAGTSAFLYGRKHGAAALSRFLVTRGAWLVVLELTLLRLAWTFNGDFRHYEMAGVIWVIGWCMILMSVLVKLSPRLLTILGGVVVVVQTGVLQALQGNPALQHGGVAGALWSILLAGFFTGPIRFGADGPNLIVLYSIVPWIAVMALGYAFGTLLALEPARRRRVMLRIGLGATALFVVLRFADVYGDLNPWRGQLTAHPWGPAMPAALAFLNTAKYPASLLFLLMTLGPTITALALLDSAGGIIGRWLTVFGRVPFFYYMLHIPLIHALALVVVRVRDGAVNPWLFANHPMGNPPPPAGYTWSLPLLYATWLVALVILYPLCRWWGGLKARRGDWWLTYL